MFPENFVEEVKKPGPVASTEMKAAPDKTGKLPVRNSRQSLALLT